MIKALGSSFNLLQFKPTFSLDRRRSSAACSETKFGSLVHYLVLVMTAMMMLVVVVVVVVVVIMRRGDT